MYGIFREPELAHLKMLGVLREDVVLKIEEKWLQKIVQGIQIRNIYIYLFIPLLTRVIGGSIAII